MAEKKVTEAEGNAYPNADNVVDLAFSVLRWRRFVRAVTRGYPGYFEEYINEISYRATVEHILTFLSGEFRAECHVLVGRIDKRFRRVTRLLDTRLWALDPDAGDLDIYYRFPRIVLTRIGEDVIRRGILPAEQVGLLGDA